MPRCGSLETIVSNGTESFVSIVLERQAGALCTIDDIRQTAASRIPIPTACVSNDALDFSLLAALSTND